MQNLLRAVDEDQIQQETNRLSDRKNALQNRRRRSQFIGQSATYDATQGIATIRTSSGSFIAESITTGALTSVGLSVPRLGNQGKVDAKPTGA